MEEQYVREGTLLCDAHANAPWRWCDHLVKFVRDNKDAEFIKAPGFYVVPIFPTRDIWIEIELKDPLPYGSAIMEGEYKPEFGNSRRIALGMWNPGEGMNSMRGVVLDWIMAQVPGEDSTSTKRIQTACPSRIHGPRHEFMISQISNSTDKWVCLWNIILEHACTFCVEESTDPYGDPDLQSLNKPTKPPWA